MRSWSNCFQNSRLIASVKNYEFQTRSWLIRREQFHFPSQLNRHSLFPTLSFSHARKTPKSISQLFASADASLSFSQSADNDCTCSPFISDVGTNEIFAPQTMRSIWIVPKRRAIIWLLACERSCSRASRSTRTYAGAHKLYHQISTCSSM